MQKHVMIGLSLTLVGTLLTACSKEQVAPTGEGNQGKASAPVNLNASGFPVVKEKITLNLLGSKAAIQGSWDQLQFFQEMEKLTNIGFKFDTPSSDSYNEKKNLAFASGEVPDLFFGGNLTVNDEITYGGQGVLIPLESLIEKYAPNVKKLIDTNPDLKRSITTIDGHIYALPQINNVPRDQALAKLWLNKQWLSNLGLQPPTTIDGLYQVLKDFKDKDPNKNGKADEIPLSFDKATLPMLRISLLSSFGFVNNRVDVIQDKVVYVAVQEGYKQYLTFMNKLTKDKLLDEEAFTQTNQQMVAKGNGGRIGVFSNAGAYLVSTVEDSYNYMALPPLTSSTNSTKMWPKSPGITRGTFAITNKNKHQEATMRWVDYLYSPEGGAFASQGLEGVGWKWSDAGKTKWSKILPEGYKNTEEFRGGKITPSAGTVLPGIVDSDFILKLDLAHVSNLDKEVKQSYTPYLRNGYPSVYFTQEEQKRLSTLEADLNTYIDQMEAKFILGNEPLQNWDKYVDTIKKMKMDEAVGIYQAAYDRWKQVK
ncbi:extracellular solute-binding protein [Paenibacillus sp. LMG 31458]|uniref:Extracellular solute-binding protein n=1 Tax=Paenibacillus phytorum TaxID=2654977 RepID=A0ABX1Y7L9_9BACL|nr:extracellular solute-binding protein [Paenibacillus phytorum]NOU76867.1 extracellular solute-binding protein [Paenibacillus phytorum]